jgi:hypothetical protein
MMPVGIDHLCPYNDRECNSSCVAFNMKGGIGTPRVCYRCMAEFGELYEVQQRKDALNALNYPRAMLVSAERSYNG